MRKYSLLLPCLALVALLSACGGSSSPVIVGEANGEGLNDGVITFRAALFGYSEDERIIEVATSEFIGLGEHAYTLVLDGKPSSQIRREGSAGKYVRLYIMAYNDKNSSGAYEKDADGPLSKPASAQIAYYYESDSNIKAKKGYNVIDSESSFYTADFESVKATLFYLSLTADLAE